MPDETGPKRPRKPTTKRTKRALAPAARRPNTSPSAADRLAAIRATGILLDLDAARLADLRISVERERDLAPAIEAHLRAGPNDIVVVSPQSVGDFLAVIDFDVSAAITPDPDPSIAHVAGSMYAPGTFHAWAGTFNLALRHVGDPRRFVALHAMEQDEPLYLLATRPQIEALRNAGVLAWNSEEVRAPPRLSARERAEELAARLALKRAPTRADGAEVALDFPDLAAAVAFVARLRHDVHHGVRVGAWVKTELAEAIEAIEEIEP